MTEAGHTTVVKDDSHVKLHPDEKIRRKYARMGPGDGVRRPVFVFAFLFLVVLILCGYMKYIDAVKISG